jgi:hypothetical protein
MEADMEEMTRQIVYFRYCGEVNTEKVLRLAKKRAEELGIRTAVIASETGRSALEAVAVFRDTSVRLVVVTHYPATTWGPKGDIPIGLRRPVYASTLHTLTGNGVTIVQGTRPFAPPSRSLDWNYPTAEGVVDKTLEVLGAGIKIAIEAAVMATDAGEVGEGAEIISCAGTFKGLDTALVVRATPSMRFFKDLEVREIIAKPRCRVRELPEYTYENWRGDLSHYYEAETHEPTETDRPQP